MISEKAWLDKSVKEGTKSPLTNNSSMLSIVSRMKGSKDDIPDNVASLNKEYKGEGGKECKYQAEPNDEISTKKISKRSCEGILPGVMRKDYQ